MAATAHAGASAATSVTLAQQKVATLSSGSTLTTTLAAPSTNGDAMVVAIAVHAGASVTVASVKDSSATSWTKGAVGYLSGSHTRIELWYRLNSPAVTSVTATLSAASAAAALVTEWTGVATASAVDRSAGGGAGSSTTVATPQLTTTNATDLVIGAVNYPSAVTSTLGTGPFRGLNNFSLSTTIHGRAAYAVTTVSGNYLASWNLSGPSGGSGGAILALKAAATTSSDTTPPTTSIVCNGTACGGTYTSPVTIALTATDNTGGSGVKATFYTTDGTDPTTSSTRKTNTGPFTIAATAAIRFYSVDNAGNAETAKTQTVTIGAASPLQVGAYWYGWYGSNGRHWQDGYVRADLAIPQLPALGQYDSRAAATISQQLDWAHQYGIDYFISSWWGAGSYEDATTHDYLLTSPSLGSTKVAILYESLALLPKTNGVIDFNDATTTSKLVSDVDYLAQNYFSNPAYLRIDGKPVLEFYVSRVWHGDYAGAIATLRSTIKQRYGYDLYLIGDEVDWDGTPNPDRIKLFDAITAYTMYSDLQTPGWPDDTGYLAGVRSRYTNFKNVADQYGVHFIPDALPQFNDRGVRLSADHYVLPPEVHAGLDGSYTLFSQFLNLDGDFLDATKPTVLITSWNEWHEDTEIEPTAPAVSSTGPTLYTQGYTYVSHGTKLLATVKAFRTAHGG
jgi:glycoprotein endo-alpha-1,2-mannosidase